MLGFKVASAKDLKSFESNKLKAGDWQATVWYQETGLFALDNNLVDSDFLDSRINMKGEIFKATYVPHDAMAINLAYGHGSPLNNNYHTNGYGDMGNNLKLNNFDLFQIDATFKF